MSSHDEILSSPATIWEGICLHPYILDDAGPELRDILGHAFGSMVHRLRQGLWATVTLTTNELTQAIDMWIARLNLIKSGLASFPIIIEGGGTNTTTQSLEIPSPADGTTEASQGNPSQACITACLQRDQYQCIVTGCKVSGGSGIEVVPIIPYAFANHSRCRDLDFWKMLEMIYSADTIDTVFTRLLVRFNHPENHITLDCSLHPMFNSGRFTVTSGKATIDQIPLIYNHGEGYSLNIGYPFEVCYPNWIKSTKGLSNDEVRTLCPMSSIDIACHEAMPVYATSLPLPSYFMLRSLVLKLKQTISSSQPPDFGLMLSSASFAPSPGTPINHGNQYPTQPPIFNSSCGDPVFAASAMLQALVDERALEESTQKC
ncbi:hypothetical protein B9Z19DRAFT_1061642 [Tuber borchii]|uniref:Uncharacterized protein n=1 Tax=Tuber borchii TaxID=42251 RepID=A0A2T7A4J9_TUBBO|nr:hypothetical protein B9Z19DRAFT_1061642 [Tuber borchii]